MVLRKSLLATSILVATLGLTACGGSSSDGSNNNPDTDTPTNKAPTAIALAAQGDVNENVAGQVIGTLSATDADANETFTFSTEDERFIIDGTSLALKPAVTLNYEAEQEVSVDVTVKDSANNTFTQTLTFAVTDAQDYDFVNSTSGESSVSYSGQIARHVLIKELYNYIGSAEGLLADAQTMTAEELLAQLNKYYKIADADYDALAGAMTLTVVSDSKQATLADISGSHKDLSGKIAGNDAKGQHKDWNDGTSFEGWAGLETNTPEGLINALFAQLVERVQAPSVITPNGKEIESLYVTADGVDLKQLTQKFLYGAVAFSQGSDDYLDNATQGKGLLTSNIIEGDAKYSNLEHQWDEGFGYFGAARNYMSYTDEEIAGKGGREGWQGYNDYNADGKIDLNAEYNFGNSTNAAKRDLGSDGATDYSKEAFDAFFAGRKLISDNVGTELTDAQLTELKAYAVAATAAWEKSISATVVHYINDTMQDLEDMKAGTYEADKFVTLAKHWSEMKGFALNLQFNPESPFNSEANAGKFAQMNELMGNKPVVGAQADMEAYIVQLHQARDILEQVYGFDADVVDNW
ncbi:MULTISPECIES: DUF4856 domain-containing protein [Pseudoalteromonas]|uniref:DUF4856 domain-containing protein n=1 Tax=Pseudoalteromonas amylolytica TaxID=1859457 RepID=A0A1S1MRA0_9GAMM|nr:MULTISPECIES: DUF4856 domain-containing protein [Pseudoalteromonas]OHU87688.1 DUF4856 domain-containing protein [Pseudoalteromonas sp. JW3]OHU91130.1 DUF4856 domain-containing protein [Pseudoalteromonas amylolytica]